MAREEKTRVMDMDELQKEELFLHTKTRTELESDLERCLERKKHLEEEKNTLYNMRIDSEAVLKQREEELSEVKMRLVSIQSEKERIERELEGFKQVKMGDQGRIDELMGRIAQLEREKKNLQEEDTTLIKTIEQLEHDREIYRAYSEEAEKLTEVKTEKLMADLRELQEINRQYRQQVQEGHKGVEEFESKMQQLIEEKAALEKKMQLQVDAQESVGEFLSELKKDVEELQKLVNEFRTEREERREEIRPVHVEVEVEKRRAAVEELLGKPERIEPEQSEYGGWGEPGVEERESAEEICEEFPEELVETLIEPPELPEEWGEGEEEETLQEEHGPGKGPGERGEPEPEPVNREEEKLVETLEPEKREEKKRFPWEEEDESLNLGFRL